jgi:hypothetical protein
MSQSRGAQQDGGVATILVGDDRFLSTPSRPFVFGRSDATEIVGLDPSDMGISAKAGAVEFAWGLWWVVNHSRKRRLLIEDPVAFAPRPLECGDRFAITTPRLVVLIPGAIYTHRLEVMLPPDAVAGLHVADAESSGTLTFDRVKLSEKDRLVLSAVFAGYLRSFPRHAARPVSYQEVATALGPPWTKITVRKQVERVRERFARHGVFFEGPRANDALAEHLMDNGLLSPVDLTVVDSTRLRP